MGKPMWFGVAGAALVMGGTFWAVDYGRRNPDSAVGRSVCAVCGPGVQPLALPGQAVPDEEAESLIPAEPIPSGAADDGVMTGTLVSVPSGPSGPVATGPTAIVIPEEDTSRPATVAALPEQADAAGEECCEHGGAKALVMPHCPADAPTMPYAAADEPKTFPVRGPAGEPAAAGRYGVADYLRAFLSGVRVPSGAAADSCPGCPHDGPCPQCTDPVSGHGLPLKQAPVIPAGEETSETPKGERPSGKKFYGPAEGKPEARLGSKVPTYFSALRPYLSRKGLDGMEECEAPADAGPGATPEAGRPVVDTMEYRPSDGRFDDARRGPW